MNNELKDMLSANGYILQENGSGVCNIKSFRKGQDKMKIPDNEIIELHPDAPLDSYDIAVLSFIREIRANPEMVISLALTGKIVIFDAFIADKNGRWPLVVYRDTSECVVSKTVHISRLTEFSICQERSK